MLFSTRDLIERALRRIKYLEDSNYRRWSDITPRQDLEEESDYRDKKDYYMLKYYLAGGYADNYPEINWKGIFDYMDRRIATAPEWLEDEVDEIAKHLNPYREQLYPKATFVGF